jgi:membrane-bound ClpP family serine protease
MKEWFKYEYGFVNIDTDNIYFTNSGNWSETIELEEKGLQKSNIIRKIRIKLFWVLSFAIGIFLLYLNMVNGRISILLIIGLPIGLFSIYNYLKTEIGSRFKLPISKIVSIAILSNNVSIEFKNFENKIEVEKLPNIEEKGIEILEKIQGKILLL